jgi:predicted nucleotidyltransferase
MKLADDAAYSVWLYGSHARGDTDLLSDVDVFVAGAPRGGVIDSLAFNGQTPSVSQYAWEEVEAMAAYGSLFFHHLRLEGKPLLEHAGGTFRLAHLLEYLPTYQLFRRDLRAFHLTVADVREAFRMGSTPEFEMAVLGTVLRHSSILGCYLLKNPCFGRTAAIEKACRAVGFTAESLTAFNTLYLFRLHEDGRCEVPFKPSWDHVMEFCRQTEIFLCRLDEVANAFERRLPEVDCESQIQCCRIRVRIPTSHSDQTLHLERG